MTQTQSSNQRLWSFSAAAAAALLAVGAAVV